MEEGIPPPLGCSSTVLSYLYHILSSLSITYDRTLDLCSNLVFSPIHDCPGANPDHKTARAFVSFPLVISEPSTAERTSLLGVGTGSIRAV